MQLKIRRSQKTSGLMTTNVIFCLDARIEFTREEAYHIDRYKLQGEIIYTSEGARSAADRSLAAAADAKAQRIALNNVDDFLTTTAGKIGHGLKAAALGAVSAFRLTITISSLRCGQHIECKSLDELLGAEDAIMTACQNLKAYLQAASTFDGRETLIDFDGDVPTIVAQASTPNPQVVAPEPAINYAPNDEPREWETADPAQLEEYEEFGAPSESYGHPFDWHDPATRQKIMIAGVVVLLLVTLHACHVI